MAALGRPAFVTAEFVKPGATVVDVGTTRVERPGDGRAAVPAGLEAARRRSSDAARWSLGDVHPAVEEVAGALTPVPGGVGPLTIAMLLKNTLTAAQLSGTDRLRLAWRCAISDRHAEESR